MRRDDGILGIPRSGKNKGEDFDMGLAVLMSLIAGFGPYWICDYC